MVVAGDGGGRRRGRVRILRGHVAEGVAGLLLVHLVAGVGVPVTGHGTVAPAGALPWPRHVGRHPAREVAVVQLEEGRVLGRLLGRRAVVALLLAVPARVGRGGGHVGRGEVRLLLPAPVVEVVEPARVVVGRVAGRRWRGPPWVGRRRFQFGDVW